MKCEVKPRLVPARVWRDTMRAWALLWRKYRDLDLVKLATDARDKAALAAREEAV
jgi:hypothetical protein